MKNKNILIIVGLAAVAVIGLVLFNRYEAQDLVLEEDREQEALMEEQNEAEEPADLEFTIKQPEDETEEAAGDTEELTAPETEEPGEELDEAAADEAVLSTTSEEKEVYTFFYGDTCPYCHDVIDWFEETGIESTLNIVRKETYNDLANSEQLKLAAETCGEKGTGVPFLFTPDKECIIGSNMIIDYLSEEAGL